MTYIAKDEERHFFVPDRILGTLFQETIPVYAITEDPRAVSAKLTLTTDSAKSEAYRQTYEYEGRMIQGTLFLFELEIVQMQPKLVEFWRLRLQRDESVLWDISGTAILELFDREGNLIGTHTMEFPSMT